MKRKLIKQGSSTLTVSLPKRWTDRNGLTKDSYINTIERDNCVVLDIGKNQHEYVEINFTGNIESLKSQLMSFYMYGADTIRINYAEKDGLFAFGMIKETVEKHLHCMVISERDEKSCTIKSFSETSVINLDYSIKNSLQSILRSVKLLHNAFLTQDQDNVLHIKNNHDDVKNFCYSAHRVLNKSAHLNFTLLSSYIRALDKIIEVSNHLRHIAKHHTKEKKSKYSIHAAEMLSELLFRMYNAFYHQAKVDEFFDYHAEMGAFLYSAKVDRELFENFGMVRDLAMNLVRQAIYINHKK